MLRAVVMAAVLAIGSGALLAQAQSPAAAVQPLASFETASIKAPDPNGIGAIDLRYFPNRFVATTVTVAQLIEQAYGLESRELVGGPDWARVERFDVTATSATEVNQPQMRLMLQSLLASRFQLLLERENRTGTIYRLTARTVRNLKAPAKPDERPWVSSHREDAKGTYFFHFDGHNAPMAELARSLAGTLRAPVVDETKLTGNYDFRVDYTNDTYFGLEPDPNVPTIFTALENQLGLKLVADKGPVPVYVIRRVSKPSAN